MKPVLALRHVPHEGLGTIEDALRQVQIPFSVVDVFREPLSQFHPRQFGGLIVMGGPMNVDETDRYPFLADEVQWIRQAIAADLPVLGVCLGSQLLAKALGARVYPNRVKEIGWYQIELTNDGQGDLLFHTCQPTETVFQWHGDTFDLPAETVQLARSPQCENQAFRYSRGVYGLQFHLEVTLEIISDWLGEPGNCGELAGLDYIDAEAIRRETPAKIGPLKSVADRVFRTFAEVCRYRQ
jgi:GMP synthase (glutamine-hydrolysing)